MSFLTVSNEEEQSWGGGGVFRTAGSLLSPDVLLLFLCWVIPGAPPNWHAHTELLGRQTVLMRHSRLFPGRTMDFELKTVLFFMSLTVRSLCGSWFSGESHTGGTLSIAASVCEHRSVLPERRKQNCQILIFVCSGMFCSSFIKMFGPLFSHCRQFLL